MHDSSLLYLRSHLVVSKVPAVLLIYSVYAANRPLQLILQDPPHAKQLRRELQIEQDIRSVECEVVAVGGMESVRQDFHCFHKKHVQAAGGRRRVWPSQPSTDRQQSPDGIHNRPASGKYVYTYTVPRGRDREPAALHTQLGQQTRAARPYRKLYIRCDSFKRPSDAAGGQAGINIDGGHVNQFGREGVQKV